MRGAVVLNSDDGSGTRSQVRVGESDLFSMGTAEAVALGRRLEVEGR